MDKINLSTLKIADAVQHIGKPVVLRSKGKLNNLTGTLKRHAFKDVWHIELDEPYSGSTFKSVQSNIIWI